MVGGKAKMMAVQLENMKEQIAVVTRVEMLEVKLSACSSGEMME